jgi:hypothetical protein
VKIGIFGNTNNYPYRLALGLRQIGVEATLLVNRREPLHRPENRDPALAKGYPHWILDCSDLGEDEFVIESTKLGPALNYLLHESSGVLLNDLGPSLAEVGSVPSIALLTGSDLTYYGSYEAAKGREAGWAPDFAASAWGRLASRKWAELVERQRRGIRSARGVSFGLPGMIPEADELLHEIGVPDDRRFSVYLADTQDLAPEPPPLRRRLRVLNGARLNWVEPMPAGFTAQDNKRTDIILHGFASYLAAGGEGELVLVEKGLHVEQTRQLVEGLHLSGNVRWLREMSLTRFLEEVRAADVVCDQLGPSFPGMTGLDAMALGRPVLANFRLDLLQRQYPDSWPVLNAESPDHVCRHLLRMFESPDERTSLGASAARFARAHLSPEGNALKCLQILGLRADADVR